MALLTNDSRKELLDMTIVDLIEYFDDVCDKVEKMKPKEE
jgi:hypothetical protein